MSRKKPNPPPPVELDAQALAAWNPGDEPKITGADAPPDAAAERKRREQARAKLREERIALCASEGRLPPASPYLRIPPTPAQALKHALSTPGDLGRGERAEVDALCSRLDQLAASAGLVGGARDLLDERLIGCLNAQERELLPLALDWKERGYRADKAPPEPPTLRETRQEAAAAAGSVPDRLAVLEASQARLLGALERLEQRLAEPAQPRKRRR